MSAISVDSMKDELGSLEPISPTCRLSKLKQGTKVKFTFRSIRTLARCARRMCEGARGAKRR